MALAVPAPKIRRTRTDRKSFTPNQETGMGDSFAARVNASHKVVSAPGSGNAHHTMMYHHMTLCALELQHKKELRRSQELQGPRPTERDMLEYLASLNKASKATAVVPAASPVVGASSTASETHHKQEEDHSTPKSTVAMQPLTVLNPDLHSDGEDDEGPHDDIEDLSNLAWKDDI